MKPEQQRRRHRVLGHNLGGPLWRARQSAQVLDKAAAELRRLNKRWATDLAVEIEAAASRAWTALDKHLSG